MREIKFRLWNPRTKEMFTWEDYSFYICEHIPILENRYILMQYTGLKDKDGKEVYEGDILKIKIEFSYSKEGLLRCLDQRKYKYVISEVRYKKIEKCNYCCVNGIGFDDIESDDKTLEIIGNIYENPELYNQD